MTERIMTFTSERERSAYHAGLAEGFRRGRDAAADLLERDADWPGDYDRAFAIIDEIRALRPEGDKP